MDGARLSRKVFAGYGKAASRVGVSFDVYRPQTAFEPLNLNNRLRAQFAAFTIHGAQNFTFTKPSDHDNALFHGLFDPTDVRAGDYFVDPAGAQGPFFVAGITPAMPPLCVGCNRTVSAFVLSVTPPIGLSSYSPTPPATTEDAETALMINWPASLLKRGTLNTNYLPSDVGAGKSQLLMPAVDGVDLRTGMVIVDDLKNRFVIIQAELQSYGWRANVQQVVT